MVVKNKKMCKEICGFCGSAIVELKNLCYVNKKVCCNKCCPEQKFKALSSIKTKGNSLEEKYIFHQA